MTKENIKAQEVENETEVLDETVEASSELEKMDLSLEKQPDEKDFKGFRQREAASEEEFIETVVRISRVAKVVKGGRRFSFSVISVVGDGKGSVGVGLGKANEVPQAIQKSFEAAKKRMIKTVLSEGGTIPFEVKAKFGAGKVLLKPASAGTGVIAGGAVRAVVEAAGVKNILSKSTGSNNPVNVLRATMSALQQLKTPEQIARVRGRSVSKLYKA